MISESIDNPKLATRLRKVLLITLLAALVLATVAAAITAYLESSDVQDETLLSVAYLVETNQVGPQYNPELLQNHHLDEGVRVWEIDGRSRHGFRLKKSIENGFHTLKVKHKLWRVYITGSRVSSRRYAIAQKLEVSTELALNSAFNTALPILCLFLLIPLLVTFIVKHSFKPLNELTDQVGSNDSLELDLSNEKEIPHEVLPFVNAINVLLQKNKAYNQRQRRFIADAAHELRTPITALSLEIENALKANDEPTQKQRQQALAKSIERLQRLVNQLLDLARAQSAETQEKHSISLNDLVRDQIAELFLLAEARNVELMVNRNEPVMVMDINYQLQHLVRNALSNAIKFSPDGGKIEVEVYSQNGQGIFIVTDGGPGVLPEDLKNLREPFYRPAEQATNIGAGLGLAICHEIASQLKGTLSLENVEPTGFRFEYRQRLS